MSRSVNLIILVGNLTRDPQMRYTPNGHAVASFGVATNRSWVSEGKEQEAVDFHNIVVWNKLAETCNTALSKGRKVFVRGRLSTRSWDDATGQKRYRTEVVAEEVIFLDAPKDKDKVSEGVESNISEGESLSSAGQTKDVPSVKSEFESEEEVNAEDIPF